MQGIKGHGFYDDMVVPIIENTARECQLTDRLQATPHCLLHLPPAVMLPAVMPPIVMPPAVMLPAVTPPAVMPPALRPSGASVPCFPLNAQQWHCGRQLPPEKESGSRYPQHLERYCGCRLQSKLIQIPLQCWCGGTECTYGATPGCRLKPRYFVF